MCHVLAQFRGAHPSRGQVCLEGVAMTTLSLIVLEEVNWRFSTYRAIGA